MHNRTMKRSLQFEALESRITMTTGLAHLVGGLGAGLGAIKGDAAAARGLVIKGTLTGQASHRSRELEVISSVIVQSRCAANGSRDWGELVAGFSLTK